MCLCPLPWSNRGEGRESAQPQIVECPVPVLQEMIQEVVREAD